ncbi:hypothetical protein L6452_21037 [Arctium lappa]|uniref:Uncharacterized protein n=1 Tax=Arctium lappa TaxID=4217 RepID=A0ACB9BC84_ARCLA|nr:hypothetical protein L6452_21037 [Arctium lappa]
MVEHLLLRVYKDWKKPSTGKEQSAKRGKRRNRKIQANLPTFYEMMATLKIHLEEMMVVSANFEMVVIVAEELYGFFPKNGNIQEEKMGGDCYQSNFPVFQRFEVFRQELSVVDLRNQLVYIPYTPGNVCDMAARPRNGLLAIGPSSSRLDKGKGHA